MMMRLRQLEMRCLASDDWVEADRGVRTEEEILQSFIDNDPEYEKQIL